MSELISITPQEAARRACDLNISGRLESVVELVRWAQNAILSASGAPVEIRAIDKSYGSERKAGNCAHEFEPYYQGLLLCKGCKAVISEKERA